MVLLKIPIVGLYLVVRWAVGQTPESAPGQDGGIGPRSRPLHPPPPPPRIPPTPPRGPHRDPAPPPLQDAAHAPARSARRSRAAIARARTHDLLTAAPAPALSAGSPARRCRS